MKSYQIHFIRHGACEETAKGQYVGTKDVSLSEDGIDELKKLDEEILRIQATLPKPPKNIKAAAAYRALLSTIDVMSPYTKANGRKYPWIEYIEKQITERVNQ